MSLEDFLRQAATYLIAISTNPPSTTTFTNKAADSTYNALLELATIFQTAVPTLPKLLRNNSKDKNVREMRVPNSETPTLPRVVTKTTKTPTLLEKLNQKRW